MTLSVRNHQWFSATLLCGRWEIATTNYSRIICAVLLFGTMDHYFIPFCSFSLSFPPLESHFLFCSCLSLSLSLLPFLPLSISLFFSVFFLTQYSFPALTPHRQLAVTELMSPWEHFQTGQAHCVEYSVLTNGRYFFPLDKVHGFDRLCDALSFLEVCSFQGHCFAVETGTSH